VVLSFSIIVVIVVSLRPFVGASSIVITILLLRLLLLLRLPYQPYLEIP
jgi:hypothetical protein